MYSGDEGLGLLSYGQPPLTGAWYRVSGQQLLKERLCVQGTHKGVQRRQRATSGAA